MVTFEGETTFVGNAGGISGGMARRLLSFEIALFAILCENTKVRSQGCLLSWWRNHPQIAESFH